MGASISGARVSDQAQSNQTRARIQETQAQVAELQRQVSSQSKHERYHQDPARVKEGLNLDVERSDTRQKLENVRSALSRSELIEAKLDQIYDIADQYHGRLMQALDPTVKDASFQPFCQNLLDRLESTLNSKDENGIYLFGGTETEVAPMDSSAIPIPTVLSNIGTEYYKGSTEKAFVDIGQEKEKSFSILGNVEGIPELVYVLKIGAENTPDHVSTSNTTLLFEKAIQASNDALDKLTKLVDLHGNQQATLEKQKEALEDYDFHLMTSQKEMRTADNMESWADLMEARERLLYLHAMAMQTSSINREFFRSIPAG